MIQTSQNVRQLVIAACAVLFLTLLSSLLFTSPISAQTEGSTNTEGCPALPSERGVVSGSVKIPETDDFTVWSRIRTTDAKNNSYFLDIGSSCGNIIGDANIEADEWTWVNYTDGSETLDLTVRLTNGNAEIKAAGREDGVNLDRILLLANDCVPLGLGDNCLTDADEEPPTISFVSPKSGDKVNNKIVVAASASDNDFVAEVELFEGKKSVAKDLISPYTFEWNVASKSPRVKITLVARDAAGNESRESITVSIEGNEGNPQKPTEEPEDSGSKKVDAEKNVGDITNDGQIDVSDVRALLNRLNTKQTSGERGGDLDGDGRVEIKDLQILIKNWSE